MRCGAKKNETTAAGLRQMGVPENEIAAALRAAHGQTAETDVEVYEENWPTIMVFLKLNTQWRYLPMPDGPALMLGLDYAAVHALLRIERVKNAAHVFDGLQAMEIAVLEARADE